VLIDTDARMTFAYAMKPDAARLVGDERSFRIIARCGGRWE